MATFKGYLGGGVLELNKHVSGLCLIMLVFSLPILSGFARPITDHFGVNSTRDAVVQLGVQLGQHISRIYRGVGDISHGSSFHNITDDEFANSFVFGTSLGAISAPDVLDMATTVFGTSIILPLFSHNSEPEETQQKLCNYFLDFKLKTYFLSGIFYRFILLFA